MSGWRSGCVIGKFLPPHLGHSHLIRTGLALSERLSVLVCVREDDPIDGDLRTAWLREIHPEATVIRVEDRLPPDDTAAWVTETRRVLGGSPDVVFTSESYGPGYASGLGAAHVFVDPDRETFPVSGTLVRSDPARWLRFLAPPVRAHFAPRVVVVGAESTGTTTLAQALARQWGCEWVPEYGRIHAAAKLVSPDPEWRTDDFVRIAETQNRWTEEAARRANGPVVLDTDALATGVWHERYVGHRSPEVERLVRPADLWVLTADDIPFVQDGTRDGQHLRGWMTERFRERLAGRRWIEVRGSVEQRIAAVLAVQNPTESPANKPLTWRPPAR